MGCRRVGGGAGLWETGLEGNGVAKYYNPGERRKNRAAGRRKRRWRWLWGASFGTDQ